MTAPAPSRATNSATLGFGPMAIPIKIYSGTEDVKFSRSRYWRDGEGNLAKVGNVNVVKDSEPLQTVAFNELVNCVTTEHGLVEVSDQEVKDVLQAANKVADITAFLPLHVLGSGGYIPEGVLQMRPDKGGEKPFILLMKALRRLQVFALVELTLRDKTRYVALLPTGRAYTLLFDDEVREDRPLPEANFKDEELEFTIEFVKIKTTDQPPVLENLAVTRLMDYATEKAKNEGVAPALDTTPTASGSDDLLAALKAAVAAAKT